jgi:predicted  nucleic acid-binding Zn-ribbon protein
LKKGIEHIAKEIKSKEETVRRLEREISKLQSQPNPDTAQIQLVREEIAKLNDELETDRAQLNAFQEEFSASCT